MSGTVYLIDELLAALGTAMSQEHVDRLLSAGLPPAAVDMCGTARIQPDGDLYQLDGDGLEVTILPCFDGGKTADLLAFTSNEPGRWWLRLGLAAYLGGDALGDTVMDEPVRVFKTPLAWLWAGAPADGLVVLDHDTARRELALCCIVAEDLAHGLELDRLLTIPAQRPQIRVPRDRAA